LEEVQLVWARSVVQAVDRLFPRFHRNADQMTISSHLLAIQETERSEWAHGRRSLIEKLAPVALEEEEEEAK
jgi:hypothetical protein